MLNRINTISFIFFIVYIFIMSCNAKEEVNIKLGQGIMAGEVTQNSVILQARLTDADTLVNDDIPGKSGVARFILADNPDFNNSFSTEWMAADSTYDFIVKTKVNDLEPDKKYYYQVEYGSDLDNTTNSKTCSFLTLAGANVQRKTSMVVVTGMNNYFFHYGKYDKSTAYQGDDKALGFPGLASIMELNPDYFVGTGDNVYFDHPAQHNYERAIEQGKNPAPSPYDGKAVKDEAGMRQKYHEQFYQPRFRQLFCQTATYWEKDDHDYRYNDADPYDDFPISHELGVKNFREQVPVTDPKDENAVTYRTYRFNSDLQVWFVENRDYRSPNEMEDGPGKTIWGEEQKEWLKSTLLESDATCKILISPTPMVGPDDAYKRDNHTNPGGFRYERDQFFSWLGENNLIDDNFYIVCGDRHWQYHAIHPTGVEEFSTGALVENNSRAGRLAGDPDSTDPEGLIEQKYIQTSDNASAGFLHIELKPSEDVVQLIFTFYDEKGEMQYREMKEAV